MLVPLSSKKVCCTTDLVAGESECGWGSFILSYDKPQCVDFARDLCQADNESDLTGSFLFCFDFFAFEGFEVVALDSCSSIYSFSILISLLSYTKIPMKKA